MSFKIGQARDFPGSPVVKTLFFHCMGLTPDQGTKILNAPLSSANINKK